MKSYTIRLSIFLLVFVFLFSGCTSQDNFYENSGTAVFEPDAQSTRESQPTNAGSDQTEPSISFIGSPPKTAGGVDEDRTGIRAILAGDIFSLLLTTSGDVWKWGRNLDVSGKSYSVKYPEKLESISNIIGISTRMNNYAYLKKDGTVWGYWRHCFKQPGEDEEEDSETEDYDAPVMAEGLKDIIAVASGNYHLLALKKDGTVWAWGNNEWGQLGDGTNESRYTPEKVSGLENITACSANQVFSLALSSDGTVWAWGDNTYGELGDGTYQNRNAPVKVKGLRNITAISAGLDYSLALDTDGHVWSWGNNLVNENTNIPIKVENLGNVIAISSGGLSLALRSDGSVWAWGDNSFGELGIGTFTDSKIPVKVRDLDNIVLISAGIASAFAVRSDGTLYGWGNNKFGTIGDGTEVNRNIPVEVRFDINNHNSGSSGNDSTVTEGQALKFIADNFVGNEGLSIEYLKETDRYSISWTNPDGGTGGYWEIDTATGDVYSVLGKKIGNIFEQNKPRAEADADQWKFGPVDIYIAHKPVLDVTYEKLVEEFGKPKEVKTLKVTLPAASDYDYMNVCVYDGFECEFSPNDEARTIEPADTVFRFDVTGAGVEMDCGLRIGMSVEEIVDKFGDRVVYSLKSTKKPFELIDINAVLEGYKPDGYYSAYTEAMFIDHDFEKFEEPFGRILVLLLKDDKLDRIVFGYPTAG